MEGETVLAALAGAVVVAFLINKFGSRQPVEHRPLHSGDGSEAADDDPGQPPAPRSRTPRLPRQRRGSASEKSAARRHRAEARSARTPVDAELLRTLEELAAHPQNRAAAVNLLRQRTGMSARHARRFINAL